MSKNLPRKGTGGRTTASDEVLAKLQEHRGYQGWRVRPSLYNPTVWLAETYTHIGRGNRKGWRALWNEKQNTYRTFATPELAHAALVTLQKELDDLENRYS